MKVLGALLATVVIALVIDYVHDEEIDLHNVVQDAVEDVVKEVFGGESASECTFCGGVGKRTVAGKYGTCKPCGGSGEQK